MKYLGLHKLLWFIIVVAYTLLYEGFLFCIIWAVYVIWHFRFPKNLWSKLHNANCPTQNYWGGYEYKDKNVWETIKR